MSWAAARIPPSSEYLLFEAYPPRTMAYTLSELKAKTSRTPMLMSAIQYVTLYQRPMGITAHDRNAAATAMQGATMKRTCSVFAGTMLSLNASLMPSAASCISPNGPTRFGPGRRWMRPRATRSNHTVYAVAVSTTKSKAVIATTTTTQWPMGLA